MPSRGQPLIFLKAQGYRDKIRLFDSCTVPGALVDDGTRFIPTVDALLFLGVLTFVIRQHFMQAVIKKRENGSIFQTENSQKHSLVTM